MLSGECEQSLVQLADFYSQEVQPGTWSLPIDLTPGKEVLLTSVYLNDPNVMHTVHLHATVGWETAMVKDRMLVPVLTLRVRSGGPAWTDPVVYEVTDSRVIGAREGDPLLPLSFITAFTTGIPMSTGTGAGRRAYCLTAALRGIGAVKLTGPIHFSGMLYTV